VRSSTPPGAARQAQGRGGDALRERIAERDVRIAALTELRTTAISRLAAQHDEILRLRQQLARYGNLRVLPTAPVDEPP